MSRPAPLRRRLRLEPLEPRQLLAGTLELLKDIDPSGYYWGIGQSAAAGDLVFFEVDDAVHGQELWRSDGTAEGTFLLKDLAEAPNASPYPDQLTAVGDILFFYSWDAQHGREL
jgi:ELWxxDGT repeat protein